MKTSGLSSPLDVGVDAGEGEGEGEGPGQSWALAPVQGRTWKYKSWKQRSGLAGEFHPLR